MEIIFNVFLMICVISLILSLGISFREHGLGFYWDGYIRNTFWLIIILTAFLVVVVSVVAITIFFVSGVLEIIKFILLW